MPNDAIRHPGRILAEDFLTRLPAEMTQQDVADLLRMSRPRFNELVNEKRSVTPDTALRLARLFGTSAEFWMMAQARWDLRRAQTSRVRQRDIERIAPWPGGTPGERLYARPGFPRAGILPHPGLVFREDDAGDARYVWEFLERRGLLEKARSYASSRAQIERSEYLKVQTVLPFPSRH